MEVSKKTCNDQEKKKMVIKISRGGGGSGIGAVVLLGGALATAVLASVFLVGRKGRSSGKDRLHCHQSPPLPENNKQYEDNEADKGQEFTFTDQPSRVYEHLSKAAVKEVETNNDTTFLVSTESLTQDQKTRVEINGGIESDAEASDQILCLITPKKLEKVAVSDDGFVIVDKDFCLLEEKLPLEPQNKKSEDEKNEVYLTKEDVTNDNSKESKNLERVYIEQRAEGAEKKEKMELDMEKEKLDDGEISEEICIEAIRRAKVDLSKDGIASNQEAICTDNSPSPIIVSQSHNEDGQKTLPPVGNPVGENDILDDDEKEEPDETVKIVQESGAVEGNQEDQVKFIEEKLVKEQEKCDQGGEGNVISPEVTNEDLVECLEVCENKRMLPLDSEKDIEKEVEGELIPAEDIEITKDDGANEEVPEGLMLNENVEAAESAEETESKSLVQLAVGQPVEQEDDSGRNVGRKIEDSPETIDAVIATVKGGLIMEMSDDKEKDAVEINGLSDEATLSDEVEESSVGTGDSSCESNCEAVWPAESPEPQQVKLINREDEAVKEGEDDSQIIGEKSSSEPNQTKAEESYYQKSTENLATMADNKQLSGEKGDSEKTFIKKYITELGMLKDRPTHSTRRRLVIGTLSVLSSLLCFWSFGLSFDKLCLIVFLTMVLSEIHGY